MWHSGGSCEHGYNLFGSGATVQFASWLGTFKIQNTSWQVDSCWAGKDNHSLAPWHSIQLSGQCSGNPSHVTEMLAGRYSDFTFLSRSSFVLLAPWECRRRGADVARIECAVKYGRSDVTLIFMHPVVRRKAVLELFIIATSCSAKFGPLLQLYKVGASEGLHTKSWFIP
jgi:hypothetical protein